MLTSSQTTDLLLLADLARGKAMWCGVPLPVSRSWGVKNLATSGISDSEVARAAKHHDYLAAMGVAEREAVAGMIYFVLRDLDLMLTEDE